MMNKIKTIKKQVNKDNPITEIKIKINEEQN